VAVVHRQELAGDGVKRLLVVHPDGVEAEFGDGFQDSGGISRLPREIIMKRRQSIKGGLFRGRTHSGIILVLIMSVVRSDRRASVGIRKEAFFILVDRNWLLVTTCYSYLGISLAPQRKLL
jgi:hypothetical protein